MIYTEMKNPIQRIHTVHKQYHVDTSRIGYLRFIFEAHEGIATITTLEPSRGLIRLAVPPERIQTVDTIVNELKKDMVFHEVC